MRIIVGAVKGRLREFRGRALGRDTETGKGHDAHACDTVHERTFVRISKSWSGIQIGLCNDTFKVSRRMTRRLRSQGQGPFPGQQLVQCFSTGQIMIHGIGRKHGALFSSWKDAQTDTRLERSTQ
eukprot:scaffold232507_cov63-Attheya_sp.AAC.2